MHITLANVRWYSLGLVLSSCRVLLPLLSSHRLLFNFHLRCTTNCSSSNCLSYLSEASALYISYSISLAMPPAECHVPAICPSSLVCIDRFKGLVVINCKTFRIAGRKIWKVCCCSFGYLINSLRLCGHWTNDECLTHLHDCQISWISTWWNGSSRAEQRQRQIAWRA